jgi:tetratricopeptide (TPR) repeat protein
MQVDAATPLCRVILIMALVTAPFGIVQSQQTMRLADSGDALDLYEQAEALLADDNSQDAYELLRAYESELAGNPYFDYLLGVTALDSGLTSEAILNLQRAVASAPEFSGARMELARALYDSAEYADARPLFAALLDESPPAAVRGVIERYINAIDSRPTRPPSRFAPYAELFSGYDTNANGSTDQQQFLGFTLTPQNQETSSIFVEAAAGFDWILPRSASFGWFLGARAAYRDNPDAPFVDAGIVNGQAGMNWRSGAIFGRAGIDAYGASRDGESNESYGGIDFMLGRSLDNSWDLSVAIRGGALRYDESIEVLDVNRTLYSLAASYRFESRGRFSIEAIGGSDDTQQAGSPYGNSKAGVRLSLSVPTGEASYLFASLGTLQSDYDGLFFGMAREDTQFNALLQLEFRDVWTDGLTLAPRLRLIDNESDVALYDYDRAEVGLLIRWAPK